MGSLRFAYEFAIPDPRAWPLQRFPYTVFYVVNDDESTSGGFFTPDATCRRRSRHLRHSPGPARPNALDAHLHPDQCTQHIADHPCIRRYGAMTKPSAGEVRCCSFGATYRQIGDRRRR